MHYDLCCMWEKYFQFDSTKENSFEHILNLLIGIPCRFNGNIDTLKRAQSDQMGKWRKEAEAMCDWLDSMEDQLESLDTQGVNTDIKDIYRRLEDCEVH